MQEPEDQPAKFNSDMKDLTRHCYRLSGIFSTADKNQPRTELSPTCQTVQPLHLRPEIKECHYVGVKAERPNKECVRVMTHEFV